MKTCTLRNDDEIIDDIIETIRNVATEVVFLPVPFGTDYKKKIFFSRTAEEFY